jgi:hypothetical protein
VRGIFGGLTGHPLYTGITGAALGYARTARNPLLRLGLPVLGWSAAAALHSFWDSDLWRYPLLLLLGRFFERLGLNWVGVEAAMTLCMKTVYLAAGVTPLVGLALLGGRREGRVVRTYLAGDPAATAGDVAALSSAWGRRRRELGALLSGGFGRWLAQRQLDELLVDLAFARWHRDRGEAVPAWLAGFDEAQCRERIAALRRRLGN